MATGLQPRNPMRVMTVRLPSSCQEAVDTLMPLVIQFYCSRVIIWREALGECHWHWA